MGFVLSQCGFEQLKLEKTIGKNIYDHGEAIVKCFRYKRDRRNPVSFLVYKPTAFQAASTLAAS